MSSRDGWWLAAVGWMVWLGGCAPAPITRVVVPLHGNDAGAVEAETCALQCRRARSYERCLTACPGARVLQGRCAAQERPPVALCRSVVGTRLIDQVTRTPDTAPAEGDTVGTALGAVGAVASLLSALSSDKEESPRGSPEPPQRAEPVPPVRREEPARVLARPEPRTREKEGSEGKQPGRSKTP